MAAKRKAPPNTPRIYSYLRFSRPEQALGDSERRQLDTTKAFAKRKGLTLDESLRMTDRGISAFRGKHRTKGVLAAFLNEVKSDRVPSGSYLVVENADRLSREGVETTLRKIIFELWDFNITLQTLSPEESYPPGCGDEPKFLGFQMYLARARDESKRKSVMVRAARDTGRKKAREEGKILTSQCPAWLRVVDGKFKPIPEAVTAIRKVFDLKRKGLGAGKIVRKLNTEQGWWSAKGNGWHECYVKRILAWDAVIGIYHPRCYVEKKRQGKDPILVRELIGEPIEGYYPKVVDEGVFYAVQQQLQANRHKGGRIGKASNLFQHLVRCPYCHGPMHYVKKGKLPKGRIYLLCNDGRRGIKCKRHSIRYDEVENTVLENCKGLKPEAVLPDPDEQDRLCESLRERIQGANATAHDLSQQMDNLVDQIAHTKNASIRDRYEKKVSKLEQSKLSAEQDAKQDQDELQKAEHSRKSFEKWQRDLKGLEKALIAKGGIELRMRMQSHLRQLIDKIEVYSDGFEKESDDPTDYRNSETISDYLYDVISDIDPKEVKTKHFGDFVRYVVKRRMSKNGRFVRVFFKTGNSIDLVPEGSIASGRRMYIDEEGKPGWEVISPNIEALRQQFEQTQGKG